MEEEFVIIKNILVRYKGSDPFVEIPDGVTCIGKQAFYYQDIQTVDMPDTVTVIDDEAFCGCKQLCEINFPDGLVKIGSGAFSDCGSLESIDLPEGLQSIGSKAFYDCWGLKKIELPETVNEIGSSAFKSSGIEEIIIPEGIEAIWDSTFETCFHLKHVVLPKRLKSIGFRAFYHCNELTDIIIPERVCDMGSEAFDNCKGLIDEDGFIIINNNLSYYCGNKRVIEIPEGVRSINSRVFYQNHKIAKVVLPESLSSIGQCAFGECVNLRDINITNNVTDIDRSAFYRCYKLADGSGFVIFNNVLYEYFGKSTDVIIPKGVEIIGAASFVSNQVIEKVIIPETVNIIEEEAFSCCSKLKQVDMPKHLRKIGNGAFDRCGELEGITIPEGIEELEYDLFDYCNKLKEIRLPKTLKSLNNWSIHDCSDLKSMDIPLGVEKIGDGQFEDCGELKLITIPESVVYFGNTDLRGVQFNVSKLGKQFKIVLQHSWDSNDEKKLWNMFNSPSIEIFDSIKTSSYKLALAERLYPDYKEYGAYLKKNYRKAIKDAFDFDDCDLLESLRNTDLIERDRVESWIAAYQEERAAHNEKVFSDIEHALSDESKNNLYDLRQIMSDLENLSKYKDTTKLMKRCVDKIAVLENEIKERKYTDAVKEMNEFGGMNYLTLEAAVKKFADIYEYKDSERMIVECKSRLDRIYTNIREKTYQEALTLFNSFDGSNREALEEAIDIFEGIEGYKDSRDLLSCYYKKYYGFDIERRRSIS